MLWKKQLNKIRDASTSDLNNAASESDIYQVKSKYIGRSGSLTQLIKNLITIPAEQRAVVGKLANEIKKSIESGVEDALKASRERKKQQDMGRVDIDVTLPGRCLPLGTPAPHHSGNR